MKKTKTINYAICDFKHAVETEAIGIVQPSGKDACRIHMEAFKKEVRLPKEFGGDMSGKKISVDPGYKAHMVIKYVKVK